MKQKKINWGCFELWPDSEYFDVTGSGAGSVSHIYAITIYRLGKAITKMFSMSSAGWSSSNQEAAVSGEMMGMKVY